jgi:hypothetical protein
MKQREGRRLLSRLVRPKALWAALSFVAVAASGCLTVVSDEPLAATTGGIVSGGPQVSCSPTYLSFAPTVDGQSAVLPVHCTNVGSAVGGVNLTMTIAGTSSPLFTAQFGPGGFPTTGLAPNQSVDIKTTYTPTGISQDIGTLDLDTNAGTVQIPLFAEGLNTSCQIMIPSESLDFGHIVVGNTSAAASFAVDNIGVYGCELQGPLQILNDPSKSFHIVSTNIQLDPKTGAFYIASSSGGGGNSRLVVTVDFKPTASGHLSADVSDLIALTGVGVAP